MTVASFRCKVWMKKTTKRTKATGGIKSLYKHPGVDRLSKNVVLIRSCVVLYSTSSRYLLFSTAVFFG